MLLDWPAEGWALWWRLALGLCSGVDARVLVYTLRTRSRQDSPGRIQGLVSAAFSRPVEQILLTWKRTSRFNFPEVEMRQTFW